VILRRGMSPTASLRSFPVLPRVLTAPQQRFCFPPVYGFPIPARPSRVASQLRLSETRGLSPSRDGACACRPSAFRGVTPAAAAANDAIPRSSLLRALRPLAGSDPARLLPPSGDPLPVGPTGRPTNQQPTNNQGQCSRRAAPKRPLPAERSRSVPSGNGAKPRNSAHLHVWPRMATYAHIAAWADFPRTPVRPPVRFPGHLSAPVLPWADPPRADLSDTCPGACPVTCPVPNSGNRPMWGLRECSVGSDRSAAAHAGDNGRSQAAPEALAAREPSEHQPGSNQACHHEPDHGDQLWVARKRWSRELARECVSGDSHFVPANQTNRTPAATTPIATMPTVTTAPVTSALPRPCLRFGIVYLTILISLSLPRS